VIVAPSPTANTAITFTVSIAASGLLVVTTVDASSNGSDTSHSVTINQGDLISLMIQTTTNTSGIALLSSGNSTISAGLQIT
jgi:hypothetical protein